MNSCNGGKSSPPVDSVRAAGGGPLRTQAPWSPLIMSVEKRKSGFKQETDAGETDRGR
jgi:hypothetical protein